MVIFNKKMELIDKNHSPYVMFVTRLKPKRL